MNRVILLGFAMALSMATWAQPRIAFTSTSHDFGAIPEEGGKVRHSFTFTNTGDKPLIITGVNASCGCTTPAWTRQAVAPGQQGYIAAEYNPMNRPGAFNKSLTVGSNAVNARMTLRILGSVTPKPREPELEYPTDLGGLRVKSQYLQFGNITTESPVTKEFAVHNATADPLYLLEEFAGPASINVFMVPDTLAVFETGKLVVTFDPNHTPKLGYHPLHFRLKTNQFENPEKAFVLLTTVEEYFPPMTAEERALAPKLIFQEDFHDFEVVNQGDSVTTTFTLTNEGQSVLEIRDLSPNCTCTTATLGTQTLTPGESTELTVTFNSTGRRGMQNKAVTIFSNDPLKPTQDVKYRAVVSTAGE
ncbi:MAG TPA: DUF1573 domain-containing protein [Cytophagales bacterium]|nr:DUF1573 domain-containing protein [Cytophagales bacterium]HAA22929.1 DUF1573 domain-containing protein [Cytophagales bacterium]HAP62585.1 DUF1573 domain-containing protein [Cytophagales bacterium]